MRPPWPNTTLNVGGGVVRALAFSPCKSFLACSIRRQNVVHVWDRHGEHTRLEGHTGEIASLLQYSLDGKYLASGSTNYSIRLWQTSIASVSAAHSSASHGSRNPGSSRGTPQAQSDIILLGHAWEITALAFSPTDSNILASGCWAGEIKLWNVINQVCIHSFDSQLSGVDSIFFSPGDTIQCHVVTRLGSMIRIARNNRMEFASTILEEPSLGTYPHVAFSPCGTCFAVLLLHPVARRGIKRELALFDLRTMAKTQSVVLYDDSTISGMAMSPDGKKLAITYRDGELRLVECHDLTIQKYVDTIIEQRPEGGIRPIAFDPTNRFFAIGRFDGRVELRTL
jgi:WD40 repeat protein